jgi:murein DD-endopeptidase MepM/ murein hydrolase activator NlpD
MYIRQCVFTVVMILCNAAIFAEDEPRPEPAKPGGVQYSLPYEPGSAFLVGQGYFDFPTHENHYDIDWEMPEETPIVAARDGVVVDFVDSFSKGALTEDMKSKANYLVLRHEDGSRTNYYHLAQNGVKVKIGQTVKEGDVIALSGNTGYSSTPHLHFFVDRLENGRSVTFPVLYKSGGDAPFDIVRGGKYLAPGGKAPPDEGPLAGIQGTGELSSIRSKLIEIVKAAKTPEQAAVDLKKHLLGHRAEYKKIYKETFAKAQKGDKSAMKELQDYLNGMDLHSQPDIARLLMDPTAQSTANEAMLVWWELFAM